MKPLDTIRLWRRRRRFRRVRSLADLAALTAWRNHTRRPVDEDARVMHEALASLGRAGFAVVDYWPGGPNVPLADGSVMRQRAAVVGFANTELKDWIDYALCDQGWPYGFWAYQMRSGSRFHAGGAEVTSVDGQAALTIGGQMDARQVDRLFPLRGAARDELHRAWLVTVFDGDWGRSDLFPDLLDAMRTPQIRCGDRPTP